MDFECAFTPELRELISRPALTLRIRAQASDLAALFKQGYGSILQLLRERGKEPAGPPFALYFNMEPEMFDVEFGFPVAEPLEGSGDVKASSTPSGKAVTTIYIGPYQEIGPAYDFLMQWIASNHLAASGSAYEVYLNDPAVTPPEMLKTEVSMLLKEE